MRVLVTEDEVALADVVGRGLRQAGFAVDLAYDGEEALEKAEVTSYEVVGARSPASCGELQLDGEEWAPCSSIHTVRNGASGLCKVMSYKQVCD